MPQMIKFPSIQESGLTFKELSSAVSRLTKERFFEQYNVN
jgi:hypothetical protein